MWIKILLNRIKVTVSILYFNYTALNWTNCFWLFKIMYYQKEIPLFTEHGSWRNWIAQTPTSLRKRKRYQLANSEWPFVQEQHACTGRLQCAHGRDTPHTASYWPIQLFQLFCKELKVTERWAVTYLPEVQHEESQAKHLINLLSFYCLKKYAVSINMIKHSGKEKLCRSTAHSMFSPSTTCSFSLCISLHRIYLFIQIL